MRIKKAVLGRLWIEMVEAAGVEPASVDPPLQALHA